MDKKNLRSRKTVKKNKHLITHFLLVAVAVIWGLGFVFTKQILPFVPPSLLNLLRFSVSSVLLFVLFFRKILALSLKQWLYGILAGVFLTLGFSFQSYALVYSSSANVSLITGLYVIAVPFFMWIVNRKRPKAKAFVAGIIGFSGIAMLAAGGFSNLNKGDLYALVCALGFTLHYIVVDKGSKGTDSGALAFVQMLTAAAFFLVWSFSVDLTDTLSASFPKSVAFPLFSLCVLSTAFAYVVQTHAQKTVDTSVVSLILSGESTLGAVFSVIMGLDKFTWYLALSVVLMAIALFISEYDFKPRKIARSTVPDVETNCFDFEKTNVRHGE